MFIQYKNVILCIHELNTVRELFERHDAADRRCYIDVYAIG